MSQRLTRKEIKRDQVQEFLTEVMEFLRDNIRSLLLGAGIVLLVLGAAAAYWAYSERREVEASEQLAVAIRIYSTEITATPDPTTPAPQSYSDTMSRDSEARKQLEVVTRDFGSSDAAAIARAYLGELAASSGDLDGARLLWEGFLSSQGNHMLASEVRLNLMSLDRAQDRGQELVTQIRAMLQESKPDLPKDVLLYQLALTQREIGLAADSRQTLQQILDEHPQSIYAGEARAELGSSADGNPLAGF